MAIALALSVIDNFEKFIKEFYLSSISEKISDRVFLFRNNDHRITLELDWEISPCKIVPASLSLSRQRRGAYLWPRTCSQLPVPGAWNNCIISVEAAAPPRRGRCQSTPNPLSLPSPTFYLSSSSILPLTRRFLRFPSPKPRLKLCCLKFR